MNATELRIGNIVFYNGENGKNEPVRYYCTINGADLRIMQDDENYLKSHEPIALTPELLEKCGFEKLEFGNGFMFGRSLGGGRIFLLKYNPLRTDCFYEHYYGTKVQYLHQLQNLYFALTGEELEINLEEK